MDSLVSRKVLAESWLCCDVSRINQLVRDGVFSAESRGMYNPSKCVPAYIQWLRGRSGEEAEEDRNSATEATVRLKTAQAVKVELENALATKEHLLRDEVLQYLEEIAITFVNGIDAFEGRLVGEIAAATGSDQKIIADSINKEVNGTRSNIADALRVIADQLADSETDRTPTA